ncbi:MAG: DAK2 domain-containing protein [Aquihabitans sp.]
MTSLDRLGAEELRQVITGFSDALRAHKEGINRLNVYPVPDGDTGTNMSLTMESVVTELEGAAADLVATCKAIGYGSLMGARGNSGVILSQILRGFTQVAGESPAIDGDVFAAALTEAARGAYEAVGNPVEGTILTVIREAAEAAAEAAPGDLVTVADAALVRGADALARTPEMLQVLADAGVVDSGGTGLMLLLHSMLNVIDGRPVPEAAETEAMADAGNVEVLQALAHGDDHDHDDHNRTGLADLRYEVMYLLEAPDETIPAFKDVWAGIGDSIVVVGGDGLYNCHIHTDDIGASIEAAIEIGKPKKIRVTDLLEEVEEERWVREAGVDAGELPEAEAVTTAVVAIATGDGIRRIFHALGVQQVITGGQSMNPSTAQILEAVEAVNAQEVIILPNNKNIIAVAEQVDATTNKKVRVVPTRGIPEGFAALIDYDPESPVEANSDRMAAAAAAVAAGEVTRAVRDSSCDVGPIAEGDYLGIGRKGILAVAPSLAVAATDLLAELVNEEHEILSIIEGEGATAADTRFITEWLDEHHPDIEAEVHPGGQPLYPYFFGVE